MSVQTEPLQKYGIHDAFDYHALGTVEVESVFGNGTTVRVDPCTHI